MPDYNKNSHCSVQFTILIFLSYFVVNKKSEIFECNFIYKCIYSSPLKTYVNINQHFQGYLESTRLKTYVGNDLYINSGKCVYKQEKNFFFGPKVRST